MNSIISYAQNFEDVMLWRALGHIKNGFYIDIGAQDPLIDSVSLAFHEHGWHGIHVEPTPHYAELLRQQRPGDTVIQAAVGNGPEVLRFFEIPDSGISTCDPVIADQHREHGFNVREITVPCIPLSAIFDSCAGREIHWLKIDVEGFEPQVISSWGNSSARPWIIIAESTLPLTQIETHQNWESMVIAHGYKPVYFDGLNRYYVSDDHPELNSAFLTPPNVFDGFTVNGTASTPLHHLIKSRFEEKINQTLAEIEQQKNIADTEIARLHQHIQWLNGSQQEREQTLSAQTEQLRREHTEREQQLHQQLQAEQQQLRNLVTNWAEQEKLLTEQTSQAQKEINTLLNKQVQREQAIATLLLDLHQQAEREKTAQAQQHIEQTEQLRREHTERKQHLYQQLQAEREKAAQAQQYSVQTEQLRREHAEREYQFSDQIATLQQQIHTLTFNTQQLGFDLSTKQDEHNRLLQATAMLETLLNTQLQAEQHTSQQLRQTLNELEQALQQVVTSRSWRLTAPLRRLATRTNGKPETANPSPAPQIPLAETTSIPTDTPDQSIHESLPQEAIMPLSSATTVTDLPADNLPRLLALHDQAFIHTAYHSVLGRQPDSVGLAYYLRRLRNGIPKMRILAQLRLSKEGKARTSNIAGLDIAIQRYQRAQLPLIGWLFRQIYGTDGNTAIERKLRSIENQIVLLSDENNRRFNQTETALAGLHNLVAHQMQNILVAMGGSPQNNTHITAIIPTQPPEPEGLSQLAPRAREIYFQLKTLVSQHTEKVT